VSIYRRLLILARGSSAALARILNKDHFIADPPAAKHDWGHTAILQGYSLPILCKVKFLELLSQLGGPLLEYALTKRMNFPKATRVDEHLLDRMRSVFQNIEQLKSRRTVEVSD